MDDKNESSEKNDVDLLLREREEKDLLMKDAKESESGSDKKFCNWTLCDLWRICNFNLNFLRGLELDETNELISANEISDKDDEDVTFCFPTFEEAKEQAEQIAKKVSDKKFFLFSRVRLYLHLRTYTMHFTNE